jgi:tetratricopeptide (TPR) repeat protein
MSGGGDVLAAEFNQQLDDIRDLAQRGQVETALDAVVRLETRIWSQAPGSVLYRVLAVRAFCHDAMGDSNEAARLLRDAVTHDPGRVSARMNAGYADLLLGDAAAARSKAQALIAEGQVDAFVVSILVAAAECDVAVQDPMELVPVPLRDDPQVAFAMGMFHRRRGDTMEARRYLEAAAVVSRREPRVALGEFLIEIQDVGKIVGAGQLTDAALIDISRAEKLLGAVWREVRRTEIERAHLTVAYNLCSALRLLNRLDEARALIDDVRDRHPGHPELARQAALLAMHEGRFDAALAVLNEPAAQGIPESALLKAEASARLADWGAVAAALRAEPRNDGPAVHRQAVVRLKAEALARTLGLADADAFLAGQVEANTPLTIALARADVFGAIGRREDQRMHALDARRTLPVDATVAERVMVADALLAAGESPCRRHVRR